MSASFTIRPADSYMKTKMNQSNVQQHAFSNTPLNTRIDDIKEGLETLYSIPASEQTLALNDNMLSNNTTLAGAGITNGSTVELVHVNSIIVRIHDPDATKPVGRFWVDSRDTVQQIKEKMYGAANAGNYFANLNATRLKDTDTLIAAGVSHRSEIYMVSNVHGG